MAKKIMVRVSDPIKKESENPSLLNYNRSQVAQDLDVRDRLAELIGKGNKIDPKDKSAIYGHLIQLLGNDKAQKVMDHIYVFNSRPDYQNLPLEDKLRTFYNMGSANKDVNQVILHTKALGSGVVPGFRESVSAINQKLDGRLPSDDKETEGSEKINNPRDNSLDIRDRLAELVGKGNALTESEKSSIYGSLIQLIGQDKAQKVMNHAYLFNNRPDIQKLPIEEKLRTFYDIGSNDSDVNQIMSKTKAVGYGVIPGFRDSVSDINSQLSGRIPMVTQTPQSTDVQKKIMIKVAK